MAETDGDVSASTARFQAFKERGDDLPPSWRMKAPGTNIGVLTLIVLVVAVLLGLFGSLLAG
jgi:hypothetical protein